MAAIVPQPAQQSIFSTALPYGVGALAVGTAGAVAALACAALAAKVIGVIVAILSVYALFGIIICAVRHSDNPDAFKENVCTHITTGFGVAVASMIDQVARSVFQAMINACLQRAF